MNESDKPDANPKRKSLNDWQSDRQIDSHWICLRTEYIDNCVTEYINNCVTEYFPGPFSRHRIFFVLIILAVTV